MASVSLFKPVRMTLPRRFDWPAALLLMAAMLTAATRLAVTKWTADLSVVQTIAVLGVIAGLALGASRFSSRLAAYLALAYGIFTIPWQIGAVQQSEALWSDRLAVMGYRLGVIVYQLINKQTVMDSLLFIVLMSALYWILSVYAGYAVVRHSDAWKAIVPTGLALFVIQYYDPAVSRRAWYLAFFIFFGLVLVARLAFVREHTRWQDNRTALPPHLSLDFIRFAVAIASVIVILAWTAPAVAEALPAAQRLWEPVRNKWNDSVNDMNYAFASLRSTRQVFSPVYGNSAVLGRGTPLGDTQMFLVRTPLNAPPGVRYYWRARTYDIYQDGQWYSSIDQSRVYNPEDDRLDAPAGTGRWEGDFTFISRVNMGSIFTPPQPLWVSHGGHMTYRTNPDGSLDVSGFVADPAITPGQFYDVRASISNPTIGQMRRAGNDYPDWVAEHYLQLPPEVTERTRQLAADITAGLDTPYDKAAAITAWLRENMTYVEYIDANPTPGQDLVDWFLFDLKQGFCNYYASAEVVMLRAAGVPARWSIGYAQGELIGEQGDRRDLSVEELTYIVRNRNAHSWPEVYFPNIGWVEFEPTVSQPDILRLSDSQLDPLQDTSTANNNLNNSPYDNRDEVQDGGQPVGAAERRQALLRLVYLMAGILAAICLFVGLGVRFLPVFGFEPAAVLLKRMLERIGVQPPEMVNQWAEKAANAPPPRGVIRIAPLPVLMERALVRIGARPPEFLRRWSQYVQLPPLAKAYNEINLGLRRLGASPAITATPGERAVTLGEMVPPAHDPAYNLVHEYQVEMFGRGSADLPKAQEAARSVRRQAMREFFRRILARFQRSEDSEHRLKRSK